MDNRRSFLASVAGSLVGSLVIQRVAFSSNAFRSSVALISDTHIHTDWSNSYRGFTPSRNLASIVSQILSSDAQIAFLCGDAARANGQKGDYENLKQLVDPIAKKMPLHIALGNHDDRVNFMSVFGSSNVATLGGKKHVTVADLGPQRWIVLDSLMYVDKVPGFLGQEQRDWLVETLKEDAKPTVLMVHHTLGEGDGDLLDTERLLAICEKHSHVKAVMFGHSHRWSVVRKGNLSWINLPAIGYNFADNEPVGWVYAELTGSEIKLTPRCIGGNLEFHDKPTVVPF